MVHQSRSNVLLRWYQANNFGSRDVVPPDNCQSEHPGRRPTSIQAPQNRLSRRPRKGRERILSPVERRQWFNRFSFDSIFFGGYFRLARRISEDEAIVFSGQLIEEWQHRNPEVMSVRGKISHVMPNVGSVEFVTWMCIGCAVLTLVASEQSFYIQSRYGKRQGSHSSAFFLSGSRYGRSSSTLQKSVQSEPKMVVSPRNDRYFSINGRYGKRSASQVHRLVPINDFETVLDYMDRAKQDSTELDNDRKDVDNRLDTLDLLEGLG